jgi:hypothetical protein
MGDPVTAAAVVSCVRGELSAIHVERVTQHKKRLWQCRQQQTISKEAKEGSACHTCRGGHTRCCIHHQHQSSAAATQTHWPQVIDHDGLKELPIQQLAKCLLAGEQLPHHDAKAAAAIQEMPCSSRGVSASTSHSNGAAAAAVEELACSEALPCHDDKTAAKQQTMHMHHQWQQQVQQQRI